MNIVIVRIEKDDGSFSLWIDDEQEFNSSGLLKLLAPIGVGEIQRVYESFGPAEFIDNINTDEGIFSLHEQFDEFAGSTIYSESTALMNKILTLMLESEQYHVR